MFIPYRANLREQARRKMLKDVKQEVKNMKK
jgi:hypothetical protein